MIRLRRVMAVILVVTFIYSFLGGSMSGVFAAEAPVSIIVDKFENGTLSFHWNKPAEAKAAVISYHRPNPDDTAMQIVSEPVLTDNKSSISGLVSDYIYDISVTVYGAVDVDNNPTGSPVGRGLMFYLPSITFVSKAVDQPYSDLAGGGREMGSKPRLKLSWKAPKSFYDPEGTVYPETDAAPANNRFVQANDVNALNYMQNSLRKIYNDNREVSSLNYRINISTELNLLNSGSSQAALLINQEGGDNYKVSVSGASSIEARVTTPDALGFISFDLWGRVDDGSSTVPTPSGINILPDSDILPGTVYYMNIKPIYKNSAGANVNVITAGNPQDQNGSLLSGERSYTSTPVRFQITKDSANNIYVKIYKINQGGLDLPRLFYEVQVTDDPSIQGDWTIKKTMDDSYFSGTSAVTIITGVNPNNEVYYKIVVKSDSPNDKLESLPMPYTLTIDTSRPPLPTGIVTVDRILDTAQVTNPSGTDVTVKSSDITISWDKPLNWNVVKNDLYFHFLLNTNQNEIFTDVPLYVDGAHWGSYPARYRLVKYISAASANIKEEGNRLTYTLKAFELFSWEGSVPTDNGTISNTDNYPEFLLPNTVYFLQMYTTTSANRGTDISALMSDKSIITSFTTLNGVERDVPLPMNLDIEDNGEDTSVVPSVNYIDLRFDKVINLDWKSYTDTYDITKYTYEIFYDIYMNTRTDTPFTLIGTTEDLHGDIGFTGSDDIQSTAIEARISRFTTQGSINLFGDNLLPNTTYYFKAGTRLVVKNKSTGAVIQTKSSIDTAILPVTTIVLEVRLPIPGSGKPLAPTDFDIALDPSQNQLVTGNSVTFSWKRQEDDVVYELIRTSQKVDPTDQPDVYISDPEYTSFLQEYDTLSDGERDGRVWLDPVPDAGHTTHPGKFTYDSTTKTCTYTVDRRMFPNKLYYFSLKAVRVLSAGGLLLPMSESVWVSIPVTTSLIDAPAMLEVVTNAELGFFWTDSTPGLTAEDYRVYAKGAGDPAYKLMTRAQVTIVKDKDGRTYYGRLTGLKINTVYDIKVTKGQGIPVTEKTGLKTRDGYHELEIRWKGKTLDDFARYDIAIMAEGDSDYTILSASDLEQYIDKDGAVMPYYTEETAMTINTGDLYYHARIKSRSVELPGGLISRQRLASNVKYHIKVRSVKIDPADNGFIAYSKYIGPVNTRTEFNQGDYDGTDREEQQKASFLDRMDALEKGYYWRIAIGGSVGSILLKGDRVTDALKEASGDSFTIDMTAVSVNLKKDEIYVPVSVIKLMNNLNKSLVIRTDGSELVIRPMTLDASGNGQFKEITARQEVKDLYVRFTIARTITASVALPQNDGQLTDINELDIQAVGLAKTDNDLKQLIHDKLYNEDTGLVSEKMNLLLNTYIGNGPDASEQIKKYAKNLADMIEKELSVYIDSTLQSTKLNYTMRDIQNLGSPVTVNLFSKGADGLITPYILYDGTQNWQKITGSTLQANASVRFNLVKTGKYVLLSMQLNPGGIPAGYWAEGYIKSIASKYDLEDVFPGMKSNLMPENIATCREVVLLYEKVTGKDIENKGLDIRQKNTLLGLDSFLSPNSLLKNIKRQETAAVLFKLFSVKKGVSMDRLKPGGRIYLNDEDSIGEGYYNSVLIIVDMEIISPEEGGRFNPQGQMTRAEVIAAFAKLLKITGDL